MNGIRGLLWRALADHTVAGRALDDDTNFFEAGLTSVRLAELVAELRRHGIVVSLIDAFRYPTPRQLGDELVRRAGAAVTQRPSRAGLPWER